MGDLHEALKEWAANEARATKFSMSPLVKSYLDSWARSADEIKEQIDATANFYRRFASHLSGINEIEGMTVADAAVRGPIWEGWTIGGMKPLSPETVSYHLEESTFLVQTLEPLATFSDVEAEFLFRMRVLRTLTGMDDAWWQDGARRQRAVALESIFVAARKLRDSAIAALTDCQDCITVWKKTCRTLPPEELNAASERFTIARGRAVAENAPPVRVEIVKPVQVEGMSSVVENTAAAALAAKQGAQETRRTRETVEQKGAAVADAVDALGAKVEAVGDEVREQGEATRETVRGEAVATRAELEKYGVKSVENLKAALAEIRQQSTALDSDAKGMALLEAQTAAFKAWREFQLASNGKIEMPRKMALRLSKFQKWGDTNGRMQWGQVVQTVKLSRFTQMWKSYERRH